MPLTNQERQAFLAEPHIGALSVSAGADRGPLTVPIWYQYQPGGELWLVTGAESEKLRRMRAAGRFSLMVERVQPTVRYVSVEGPVTGIGPMSDQQHREMVERYMPPDRVEEYLAFAEANLGEHVLVTMRPARWLSADMGA